MLIHQSPAASSDSKHLISLFVCPLLPQYPDRSLVQWAEYWDVWDTWDQCLWRLQTCLINIRYKLIQDKSPIDSITQTPSQTKCICLFPHFVTDAKCRGLFNKSFLAFSSNTQLLVWNIPVVLQHLWKGYLYRPQTESVLNYTSKGSWHQCSKW